MKGKEDVCRLCGQVKRLIKAHVIPDCFQSPLKGDDKKMVKIDLKNDSKGINSYSFSIDGQILCKECDNSFSAVEKYTSSLLDKIRNHTLASIRQQKSKGGHTDYYYQADLAKVKKCLLSILWRMSISKLPYLKSVNLGPLEDLLKSRLHSDQLMAPEFFPVMLYSLKQVNDLKAQAMSTELPKLKYNGSALYVFHIPEFLIFFYATKNASFEPDGMSLRPDGTLLVGEDNGILSQQYLNAYYKTLPTTRRR